MGLISYTIVTWSDTGVGRMVAMADRHKHLELCEEIEEHREALRNEATVKKR